MNIERQIGLRAVMPDGVALVADAWLPDSGGPWPVLLQRLPYGRSVASTPVVPHPEWFARHGYAVVVQDCRGRGDSEGVFEPFVHEGPDGAASIEWAAGLPFSDGRVATYGFSYQGLNQLYAAARRPKGLVAMAPMMCAPDPQEGWTYEGGALRWPFVCFWSAQLAGQDLRCPPVPFDTAAVPIRGALGSSAPHWFDEWITNADNDAYWEPRRPDLSAIEVPAFSVLGWFDDFSSGTARLIAEVDAEAWCGPWSHMPWGTVHGGHEFGPDGSPAPVWSALIDFLDRAMGRTAPSRERINYYVVGEGWRAASHWPPASVPLRLRALSATGNALSRWGDGTLIATSEPTDSCPTTLVAEPHVPVPGGPFDFQEESALHDRRDIACFTSAPLTEDLVVAGTPEVAVTTTADVARHDLIAALYIVSPDGTARAISGYASRRLTASTPGSALDWRIDLRPIAARYRTGDRIRLTLSGARFPAFDRNAHDERQSADTRYEDQTVATISIHEATVVLPIVGAGH